MINFGLILLSIISITSVNCELITDSIRDELVISRFQFAINSFDSLSKNRNENLVYSPYGVFEALILLYVSAEGDTEKELRVILDLPQSLTQEKIRDIYTTVREKNQLQLLMEYSGTLDIILKTPSCLFINSNKNVRPVLKKQYDFQMEEINFQSKQIIISETIKRWLSHGTGKRIQNFTDISKLVNKNNDLFLGSGAYFTGLWKSGFQQDFGFDIFHGTVEHKIKYMRQTNCFYYVYSQELDAQVLRIPYYNKAFAMYIFLPSDKKTSGDKTNQINNLIGNMRKIRDQARLGDILNLQIKKESMVDVSMPEFTMENELSVYDILHRMDAFVGKNQPIEFPYFLEENSVDSIGFSNGLHKAKIEVSMLGDYGGVDGIDLCETELEYYKEPIIFKANRPFVYLVYNELDWTIVFNGIYRSP